MGIELYRSYTSVWDKPVDSFVLVLELQLAVLLSQQKFFQCSAEIFSRLVVFIFYFFKSRIKKPSPMATVFYNNFNYLNCLSLTQFQ